MVNYILLNQVFYGSFQRRRSVVGVELVRFFFEKQFYGNIFTQELMQNVRISFKEDFHGGRSIVSGDWVISLPHQLKLFLEILEKFIQNLEFLPKSDLATHHPGYTAAW